MKLQDVLKRLNELGVNLDIDYICPPEDVSDYESAIFYDPYVRVPDMGRASIEATLRSDNEDLNQNVYEKIIHYAETRNYIHELREKIEKGIKERIENYKDQDKVKILDETDKYISRMFRCQIKNVRDYHSLIVRATDEYK